MSAASSATTTVPTRDRIVEAALRLFSERGTTAVSMRELADAAGVTVPGLYYHFASKADLIREVYRAQGFAQEPHEIELPDPAPVETIIVSEAGREFTRFIGQREFLSLMQGEAVLGDEDALEVGRTLGGVVARALGRRCSAAPTTSHPTPTSTPRPTASPRSSGGCSSSTSGATRRPRITASNSSPGSSPPRSEARRREHVHRVRGEHQPGSTPDHAGRRRLAACSSHRSTAPSSPPRCPR